MPKTTNVVPWSDEQLAAIDMAEYLDDSFMVQARAGTGKTTTCLGMVPKLRGATWFCAFGKRISDEINHKIKQPKWGIDTDRVRVSTVHAGGRRIFNRKFPVKEVTKLKIYNMVQEKALTNRLYRFNGWRIGKLVELAKQAGIGVLAPISDQQAWYRIVDHFGLDVGFGGSKSRDWDPLIEAAQDIYMESLEMCLKGILDFSDMPLAPLYFECKMPKYANLMVDEAQDISPLRLALLLGCLAPDGRMIAVGDPNQAIFGFTGSDDQAMATIQRLTGSSVLPLTISRRCTKLAIARAQAVVPDIRAADDAIEGVDITCDLEDDPTGAHQALRIWDIHKGKPFSSRDVILCRNNRPLATLAFQLLRKHIPCYVEGKEDGMGLVNLIKTMCKDSLRPITNVDSLAAKVSEWRDEQVWLYQQRKQNYKAEYVNDQAETIIYLSQALRAEGSYSVHSLLKLITDLFEDTGENGEPRCITLSTIHKAKGKEWDRVFLLGRNKYMPSQFARQEWEQQQERNLSYVADTRNRQEFIEVNDNTKGR